MGWVWDDDGRASGRNVNPGAPASLLTPRRPPWTNPSDDPCREQFLDRLAEWQDRHWAAIGAIADNLLAHETLDQEMLEQIVEPWLMDV